MNGTRSGTEISLQPRYVDESMKRLVECYGKEATCFLRVHAAEDVAHAEKAWALVSEFAGPVLAQVHANFVESAENYRLLLEQVARQADTLVD